MNYVFKTVCFLLFSITASAQTISIKQFGAKGDGRTNDQQAFEKAAEFINKKKSNVTLTIPAGIYRVGRQEKVANASVYLAATTAMELKHCSKIKIIAKPGAQIKYIDNLKFGSFNPATGEPYKPKLPFYDASYSAQIGCFLFLDNCNAVQINGLELNGNSDKMIIGGQWGDVGIQRYHYGILAINTINLSISNCYIHHFGLDGISLHTKQTEFSNNKIINCRGEYNGRCGLSWLGGNGLLVENCSWSFTGKGAVSSSPACGVDLECENKNVIQNGKFVNCTFENNAGCGLLADSGPSQNNTFDKCTFWGVTNWSVWITKPSYSFNQCNFYGSFVHGYVTDKPEEATRFTNCLFEDKLYKGVEPYGKFLLESDGRKLMYFTQCTFNANSKKVIWYNGAGRNESKAQLNNCTFNVKTNSIPQGDFYTVMRNMKANNLTLNLYFDKSKKYYVVDDNTEWSNLKRTDWSK